MSILTFIFQPLYIKFIHKIQGLIYNSATALIVAEKIRQKVEEMNRLYGEKQVALTVSLGVSSTVPELGTSEEEFIERADSYL